MNAQPIDPGLLDEITGRVLAATVCPMVAVNGRYDGKHTWAAPAFKHKRCALCGFMMPTAARIEETAALLTEIDRLRSELRIGSSWECPACGKENRRDTCLVCETDRPDAKEGS